MNGEKIKSFNRLFIGSSIVIMLFPASVVFAEGPARKLSIASLLEKGLEELLRFRYHLQHGLRSFWAELRYNF